MPGFRYNYYSRGLKRCERETFMRDIMKKAVKVVAAISGNDQNKILCGLRSPQMAMPNMWVRYYFQLLK